MDLVPFIFHERQEPGSQLCAQHCLNNLLQQSVYTEIDLADVARKLDEQENAARYAREPSASSYNYDDTGFFSISVLEKAMQVWDLTLVRWRGEAMRPYQDAPEEQAGFILNLNSHWFALRRFGSYTRWYNLNSFLERPEWISPTYLHMVLKQAEEEGYSVFVIRRAGEGAGQDATIDPGEAHGWGDAGVGELPESSADQIALALGEVSSRSGGHGGDSELGGSRHSTNHFPSLQAGPSGTTSTWPDPEPASGAGSGRRRRRQEDLTSDGVGAVDLVPGSYPGSGSRTPQPSRSYVEVAASGAGPDEDEELDEVDNAPSSSHAGAHNFPGMYGGPTDFQYHNRSYDDEDEALQAALRASMEDVPDGYVMPELAPLSAIPPRASPPLPTPPPVAAPAAPSPSPLRSATREDSIIEDTDDDEPAHEPSPEELRRARLARFQ
ncbi:Josephin-domain-containing protein [Cutaneotrichosporon oleaginosum]|uniref:ubiquitinyl hydrolase 1 n=1 Tax=Cutaneotrichosporon oleaginosum TaxID=879819 RepID=A0A0J1BCT7_9TREE|nr:Josephin-domain-containing protein [Cutaneotrichosporon oleaginosum]KLT45874.1 Josephin-domain-containing protein [Cutaneotrichosporon oleaginosum]